MAKTVNDLTTDENKNYEVTYQSGGVEVRLTPNIVKNFLTSDANISIAEYKFFTELCKARGLNPFLREAYIVKYKDYPAQIVTGKSAILKRALSHRDFNGMESGIIVKSKETKILTERNGYFIDNDDEVLIGGWARVYRKNWSIPKYVAVAFSEVGKGQAVWKEQPAMMTVKVAEVRALRDSFPEETSGMYEKEELLVEEREITNADSYEKGKTVSLTTPEDDDIDPLDGDIVYDDEEGALNEVKNTVKPKKGNIEGL